MLEWFNSIPIDSQLLTNFPFSNGGEYFLGLFLQFPLILDRISLCVLSIFYFMSEFLLEINYLNIAMFIIHHFVCSSYSTASVDNISSDKEWIIWSFIHGK
jgi:hypothetical protein